MLDICQLRQLIAIAENETLAAAADDHDIVANRLCLFQCVRAGHALVKVNALDLGNHRNRADRQNHSIRGKCLKLFGSCLLAHADIDIHIFDLVLIPLV